LRLILTDNRWGNLLFPKRRTNCRRVRARRRQLRHHRVEQRV